MSSSKQSTSGKSARSDPKTGEESTDPFLYQGIVTTPDGIATLSTFETEDEAIEWGEDFRASLDDPDASFVIAVLDRPPHTAPLDADDADDADDAHGKKAK